MATHVAIYGSHDSSVCLYGKDGEPRIYELERLTGIRNYAVNKDPEFGSIMKQVKDLYEKEYGSQEYLSCFYGQLEKEHKETLLEIFGFIHFEEISHHYAHAAGALYQSDFDQALIISSDSGGHEMQDGIQTFCIFEGDKFRPMNQVIKKLANIPLDACGAYTLMAVPIAEIKKDDAFTKYLTYAGKIMGLAAYGKIRPEWIEEVTDFYYGSISLERLTELGNKTHLDLSGINTISGQDAYDLAATSQYVFEIVTMRAIRPFVEKYQLPVILTGGGGLNVLFNTHAHEELDRNVFVPVNPNDCGLSFGMLMLREPLKQRYNITYSGIGITDIEKLGFYQEKYGVVFKSTHKEIADLLLAGKIIGVMMGNSEVGPRALGHRSILCWPRVGELKEKLNDRVKFREWFRPFAPVVREQDAEKFFEGFGAASPFMSFALDTNYHTKFQLPAIVHVDGTSRVQTVNNLQNPWLYELLTTMLSKTNNNVLLNTSFNTKGKPILTTVKEAFEVLATTDLDCVLIEGYLFSKEMINKQ